MSYPAIELSDELLLDAVRRQDEAAFNILFQRYHASVYGLILRFLGEAMEAEDVVQETFVVLFRRPPRNGRQHNLKAWLFSVALNLGRNTLRSGHRRVAREERASVIEAKEDNDPIAAAERREERKVVRAVLKGLPANYQTALLLRHGGLSYLEIGDILGIQPNAVGMVLARAGKQFRDRYLELSSGQGEKQYEMS